MKKLIAILVLLHIGFTGIAQKNIQQIFDTYQHMDGVVSVTVAKPMFSLLNKLNINTDEKTINNLKPMLKGINSLRLLVVENGWIEKMAGELPVNTAGSEKLSAEQVKQ
ncbi:MAG: DUF4252 domain-containing protein, partial [Chitinophagaceae bacterium]